MVKNKKNTETYHKKIGLISSFVFHFVILCLILLAPPIKRVLPLPGYEGIMVRFGTVEEALKHNEEISRANKNEEQTAEAKKPYVKTDLAREKSKSDPVIRETVTSEKENIVIKNQPAKKNESAATSAEQSARAKEDYSKLFKSTGNKSSGGTRGDPLGSRDSDILEGITKGKGRVGDGLDARGVMYEPAFEDSSQKSGTVVVRICINDEGKVISARYTQKGSTTTDSELINIAVSNSKKYRFSPSQLPEQCGTVSITFIVR
jgi:hypothetical protein